MIEIISHRGNTSGPQKKDNIASKLEQTAKNMLVEVDVWNIDKQWYLGHDAPEAETSIHFISNKNFILHAKNLQALTYLTDTDLHYFWHQEDDFTLTSNNLIWTYPKGEVTTKSIIVCQTLEEVAKYKDEDIWGLCTDYAEDARR